MERIKFRCFFPKKDDITTYKEVKEYKNLGTF